MSINTSLNDRISAFAKAGLQLHSYLEGTLETTTIHGTSWQDRMAQRLELAERKNSWFTKDTLEFSIRQWAEA
jgi:hypothetical protein